jgi:hypothetical protein
MLVNSNLTLPARQDRVWVLIDQHWGMLVSLNLALPARQDRVRFLLINTVDGDEVSSVRSAGPATQSSF